MSFDLSNSTRVRSRSYEGADFLGEGGRVSKLDCLVVCRLIVW